jgi:hypothetical protein
MPSSGTEAPASTGATASTATAASTVSTVSTGAARAAGPPDALGRTAGGDEGSAVVEFVALGTLLLVPVVYFVLAVAQVQAGAFGVVAAAQQASQVLARAEPGALSDTGLTAAAQLAAADQGFAPDRLALRLECSDGACAEPGAVATVHATLEVPLPLVPGFTDLDVAVLTSSATVVIGRYG